MKDSLRFPYYIGQTVFIQGYAFVVCDIWTETLANGRVHYRWRGVMDGRKSNNPLRHTSFNGHKAVYGGYLSHGQ